jgi:hypothetical protein
VSHGKGKSRPSPKRQTGHDNLALQPSFVGWIRSQTQLLLHSSGLGGRKWVKRLLLIRTVRVSSESRAQCPQFQAYWLRHLTGAEQAARAAQQDPVEV